jgi:hypothetical protein
MNFSTFTRQMQAAIPVGTILDNPGGGTSEILSYSSEGVSYRRGRSTIYVSLRDLYEGYAKFRGRRVSSLDLKVVAPSVFDSQARPAGHSCNCTFLFLALQEMGLVTNIYGRGVRGDPYFVDLSATQADADDSEAVVPSTPLN